MYRPYQLYDGPWTRLFPTPHPVQRFSEYGSYEGYGARDDADVLLDLTPNLEICSVLAHVDPVGKPGHDDTEAHGGADDGEETDREDAHELEAAAFVHRSEVEEEYDWYCPEMWLVNFSGDGPMLSVVVTHQMTTSVTRLYEALKIQNGRGS